MWMKAVKTWTHYGIKYILYNITDKNIYKLYHSMNIFRIKAIILILYIYNQACEYSSQFHSNIYGLFCNYIKFGTMWSNWLLNCHLLLWWRSEVNKLYFCYTQFITKYKYLRIQCFYSTHMPYISMRSRLPKHSCNKSMLNSIFKLLSI